MTQVIMPNSKKNLQINYAKVPNCRFCLLFGIKAFFLFLFVLSLQGCVTGSMLRTARVLDKNQLEISGGIAQGHVGAITQVVIAAYGITNSFEIESVGKMNMSLLLLEYSY